jgi:hypothetical protein
MIRPTIIIRCDGNARTYQPGDTLRAEYWLESVLPEEVKTIEISVLWYTEGKGDQDLSVHEFRRVCVDQRKVTDARCPGEISTVLPNSPLTYEGQLIKLRWCVRVRAFLTRGREVLGQFGFRVGSVPSVRAPAKPKLAEPSQKNGSTEKNAEKKEPPAGLSAESPTP